MKKPWQLILLIYATCIICTSLVAQDDKVLRLDSLVTATDTLAKDTILSNGLTQAFDKRRQQAYVFFVLGWVLNSVDAYVDAHLASFDVNEDISAHIQPVGIMTPGNGAYGLSISFTNNVRENDLPLFQY